jgi:putative ABC transport system substrate-binding protein
MKRRTFIAGSAILLAASSILRAQGTKPIKRLAMLRPDGPVSFMTPDGAPQYRAFFEELGNLGYAEGQNLIVFRFSAEGYPSRYRALMQQAIDAAPDVIWCPSPAPSVLTSITTTIPIVVLAGDPIAFGFTTNLARPSSNIAGVTIDAGQEIWGKRLSILREAVENLKKPAFLAGAIGWEGPAGRALRGAASALGLPLVRASLKGDHYSSDAYASAFEEAKLSGVDGLLVGDSAENFTHRNTIVALAVQHRLPTIYSLREYVLDGGLLAYATDLSVAHRAAASQIARLFAGFKPADVPFVQPTRFQLIANVKSAQAIGLTLPPSLLLRADEVIE